MVKLAGFPRQVRNCSRPRFASGLGRDVGIVPLILLNYHAARRSDRRLLSSVFKGTSVISGRKATFNGTRALPLFKKATIKLPLWMGGSCAPKTAGFAKAKFRGVSACDKLSGRLKKGTWTQFNMAKCVLIEPRS